MAVIYVGIAWLIGLALGALSESLSWLWLWVGLAGLVAVVIFRHYPRARLALSLLAIMCFGAVRYQAALPNLESPEQVAYYNGRGELLLTGTVTGEPAVSDRATEFRLTVEQLQTPGSDPVPVNGQILIRSGRYSAVAYGDRLRVEGILERPPDEPLFSRREYLARQGVHSQMISPGITLEANNEGSPIYRAIYAIKDRAQATIQRSLPDPQAALLTGILLGDDSAMPPILEEQFRTTGMTHIIAISGFNIAILTGLLLAMSRPLFGLRWSAWFVLLGIGLYTVLVGADAAVVRAAIMGALLVIATRLLGRPTFAPAGLFTAAIAMTLVNPFILWDVGFQLSFAATLGLMVYVGPWSQWTQNNLCRIADPETASRLTRTFSELILATMAAMLLTLPLILYHFERLSLISPIANLFILPAQPGVMIWGGLATLTGMAIPALGQLFAWVAWLFLSYTIGLVRLFAVIPAASLPLIISPAGVAAFYLIIFGVTWLAWIGPERRGELVAGLGQNLTGKVALAGAAISTILVVAWALDQPDGKLHITFFDVGQGDSTFIQTPSGRQILVDGGAYPTVLHDHLGREIPFWDRNIDLLIATHPDADHVAGLPGVFNRYVVDRLITNSLTAGTDAYRTLLTTAADSGTPIHQAVAGEVIAIEDDLTLEVLNPPAGAPESGEQHDNDNSVVLRLVYGNFSLLLTGDAGEEAERDMLRNGRDLSSLVYKAGHHGAKSSSTRSFLEAVRPGYIVVSAGEGNRYGHPSPELLGRAVNVGAAVLRTDELGTIEVISDGRAMWWVADGK